MCFCLEKASTHDISLCVATLEPWKLYRSNHRLGNKRTNSGMTRPVIRDIQILEILEIHVRCGVTVRTFGQMLRVITLYSSRGLDMHEDIQHQNLLGMPRRTPFYLWRREDICFVLLPGNTFHVTRKIYCIAGATLTRIPVHKKRNCMPQGWPIPGTVVGGLQGPPTPERNWRMRKCNCDPA
jgi:hypothetical protein